MSSIATFKELKQKMKDAKAAARLVAKEAFKEISADLFSSNPELVSFSWTQYTPYFNDGEACTFRCHTGYPSVAVNKDGEELEYDSNYGEGDEGLETYTEKVSTFLSAFDDDDFEQMFGDHVRVTVSRTGVEVDEYDHD